jgi:hypothetical protein
MAQFAIIRGAAMPKPQHASAKPDEYAHGLTAGRNARVKFSLAQRSRFLDTMKPTGAFDRGYKDGLEGK